ncbi:MAG: LPP20 family lipoprotein [Elusimicrobiota bacterium]
MINRKIPLLAACAMILAAGCAGAAKRSATSSGGPRPQWADGDSADFPRATYITGVGSADDEGAAAERARGEVAKVFSADVSVLSTTNETEANANTNGKESHSFSNDVAQKVRTTTQKVMEGVDIVARWKDPTGRYYALAALPKAQALLAVTEKSTEIDTEAGQYKAALASATDPFGRAKAAAKLLALSKAQASLAADSRVLGGGPLASVFDAAAVRTQAAQALSALDVVVAVSGDGADAVQTAVVTGLNAVGLTAKSGSAGDKADLTATAQVTAQEQDSGDRRWKRYRSGATVSLQDGRSGKIFSTFDVTSREDAVDASEARRRSLASLSKSAAEKVTASINDFFANQ